MITSIPKVRLRQFDIGQVVKLTGAYSKDERLFIGSFSDGYYKLYRSMDKVKAGDLPTIIAAGSHEAAPCL